MRSLSRIRQKPPLSPIELNKGIKEAISGGMLSLEPCRAESKGAWEPCSIFLDWNPNQPFPTGPIFWSGRAGNEKGPSIFDSPPSSAQEEGKKSTALYLCLPVQRQT